MTPTTARHAHLGALTLLSLCLVPSVQSCQKAVSESAANPKTAQVGSLSFKAETFTLANGMRVTLHEDHTLPRVYVNTWYAVGSRDEAPGRSGFAHLFEHLMFMGTGRVPGNTFDVTMESGGGWNNASTGSDRTNYYSEGPRSLLPTLLWLDADRMAELDDHMTQEKLDAQRAIVRNERRQNTENVPYGIAELLLAPALYPKGHPYAHPVIGSHEDLEAASVEDVVTFFREHYIPSNGSLVVAGDFDPATIRPVIESTFGAIPQNALDTLGPESSRPSAAPVRLRSVTRISATDNVGFPKLILTWHSPAYLEPGDGEMDIIASILAGGPSSRLEERLVLDLGLANEVDAYQASAGLGSVFHIEAIASEGADLAQLERVILEEVARLQDEGPFPGELQRVRSSLAFGFLKRIEGLAARADRMNLYLHHYGEADGFQRDLERWTTPDANAVGHFARTVLVDEKVVLTIYPEGDARMWKAAAAGLVPGEPAGASPLDQRPDDFKPAAFTPPTPIEARLSNGIPVLLFPRPGTRLFAGRLIVAGGESIVPATRAGLAEITASMLHSGAGGRDPAEFADAVESLGAEILAEATRTHMVMWVDGLAGNLDGTMELFADLVLRPNLDEEDFEFEVELAIADIETRVDDPSGLAYLAARSLVLDPSDPRSRPVAGLQSTVESLDLGDVKDALPNLLRPDRAALVFSGDLDPKRILAVLEDRFGSWTSVGGSPIAIPAAMPLLGDRAAADPRFVLIDRPGAPQTVVRILKAIPAPSERDLMLHSAVNTALGGGFTSRLNQALREEKGYTYGAWSQVLREGDLFMHIAGASVRTDVTAAALVEFRNQFQLLRSGGMAATEFEKARETLRSQQVESVATTTSLAGSLSNIVENGRETTALQEDREHLDTLMTTDADALARTGPFGWEGYSIVLVGDKGAILPQLEAAGFRAPEEIPAAAFVD